VFEEDVNLSVSINGLKFVVFGSFQQYIRLSQIFGFSSDVL
jgi:hypothetical protein